MADRADIVFQANAEIVEDAPPISLMGKDEARATVERIRQQVATVRGMLLHLYERQGWKALGYSSWRACVMAEFEQSQSWVYYQLAAARVAREVSTMVENVDRLSERQLRPLAALPAEQQVKAYQKAVELAGGGEPTARHVKQAAHLIMVDPIKQKRQDVQPEVPLPTGQYDCLVIDPPWQYALRDEDASHRNRCPYPAMSFSQILDLPVPELLPNGVLWLWTTNNMMGDACRLLTGWDCELKTILTWVKVASTGSPHIGTGHWLRNATEHCLLAVRGNVPSFSHLGTLGSHPTVMAAPRGEHSAKPPLFYDLVEQLSPQATKLEMFAREHRPGWKAWGNQLEEN